MSSVEVADDEMGLLPPPPYVPGPSDPHPIILAQRHNQLRFYHRDTLYSPFHMLSRIPSHSAIVRLAGNCQGNALIAASGGEGSRYYPSISIFRVSNRSTLGTIGGEEKGTRALEVVRGSPADESVLLLSSPVESLEVTRIKWCWEPSPEDGETMSVRLDRLSSICFDSQGVYDVTSVVKIVCVSSWGGLPSTHVVASGFGRARDVPIMHFELEREVLLGTFDGHSGAVSGLDEDPDRRLLISSSYDGTVRVWDKNKPTTTTEENSSSCVWKWKIPSKHYSWSDRGTCLRCFPEWNSGVLVATARGEMVQFDLRKFENPVLTVDDKHGGGNPSDIVRIPSSEGRRFLVVDTYRRIWLFGKKDSGELRRIKDARTTSCGVGACVLESGDDDGWSTAESRAALEERISFLVGYGCWTAEIIVVGGVVGFVGERDRAFAWRSFFE